jgi:hypothetical protein
MNLDPKNSDKWLNDYSATISILINNIDILILGVQQHPPYADSESFLRHQMEIFRHIHEIIGWTEEDKVIFHKCDAMQSLKFMKKKLNPDGTMDRMQWTKTNLTDIYWGVKQVFSDDHGQLDGAHYQINRLTDAYGIGIQISAIGITFAQISRLLSIARRYSLMLNHSTIFTESEENIRILMAVPLKYLDKDSTFIEPDKSNDYLTDHGQYPLG